MTSSKLGVQVFTCISKGMHIYGCPLHSSTIKIRQQNREKPIMINKDQIREKRKEKKNPKRKEKREKKP